MQGAGYEIKSGKHYAFKGGEQKKFIRLRSLGKGYSEEEIKAVIEGKSPQRVPKKTAAKQPKQQEKSVNLLSYSALEKKAKECTSVFDGLNAQIKTAEKRMTEVQVLKKHIINYAKLALRRSKLIL